MAQEISNLESPIDVMCLIHKALRIEAARAEEAASQLETGDSLQRFKLAFNSWATTLLYHAELEDRFITGPLARPQGPGRPQTADTQGPSEVESSRPTPPVTAPALAEKVNAAMLALEDESHMGLVESVQDVLPILNEEIGKTSVITRTKQHLYRQVVALRIAQEDHLETEETMLLPMVRHRLSERQQLEAARGLLIDEEAQDPRWIIDRVARDLDADERQLLAELEARFLDVPTG